MCQHPTSPPNRVDQPSAYRTVAITGLARRGLLLERGGRSVGALGLVVTLVDDEAGLRVTRGSVLTNLGASRRCAITTLAPLFFFRPTPSGCRLVASIVYRAATHAGSGIVNHPVDAKDTMLDGLLGDQPQCTSQVDGLANQTIARERAKPNLEVAQAAFGGIDSLEEAKTLAIIVIVLSSEVAQRLATVPFVEDAPGAQQK